MTRADLGGPIPPGTVVATDAGGARCSAPHFTRGGDPKPGPVGLRYRWPGGQAILCKTHGDALLRRMGHEPTTNPRRPKVVAGQTGLDW